MHQLPLTAVTISLVLSGCSLFASKEDDTPAPVVQPVVPQPFASPIVPAKPKTRVAALIQPTNPNERLRAIKSGRADPFAALVPATSEGQAGGASANGSSAGAGSPSSGSSGRGKTAAAADRTTSNTITIKTGGGNSSGPAPSVARSPRSTSTGSSPSGRSPVLPSPGSQPAGSSPVPSLPPLPQPELAKGVRVTGIAFVNGIPRAIVQAPDEPVSRAVSAGDRLSNGQILVKRIETSSAEPVVILEQYGTEVAVGVGTGVQLASTAPVPSSSGLPAVPALWYSKGR